MQSLTLNAKKVVVSSCNPAKKASTNKNAILLLHFKQPNILPTSVNLHYNYSLAGYPIQILHSSCFYMLAIEKEFVIARFT